MNEAAEQVLGFRLRRFLRKPWSEKARSIRCRFKRLWNRLLPSLPLPVRLPFGGWWLAWNDVCGDAIFNGNFEEPERRFVERFLGLGMTVLDIGAHHGFYTLLASFKVGSRGRVVAFEPSPRERKKLLWHLWLNRCKNVQVENSALGSYNGEAQLFLVDGRDTGCNSLRKPNVAEPVHPVRVPVMRLDDYLRQRGIERIDFVKMDVEGAELEVLKGATQLLRHRPRPVWLVEVYWVRTEPWGYQAAEIVRFLEVFGYSWFVPQLEGHLVPVACDQERFDGNFVAVPEERLGEIQPLVNGDGQRCRSSE
ncbi:MAG: FkbM family methyltransferase [Candidatus Methanomethyliaceae archaeon]